MEKAKMGVTQGRGSQKKSTRFLRARSAPLTKIEPEEALSLSSALQNRASCPFFPPTDTRTIRLSLGGLTECSDLPLTLFRCAYPELFFERSVLELGGFSSGRSLLECDSGNNNLGFFKLLEQFFANNDEDHNYHISNYSGGRGDYFGMHQLALIHSEEQKLIAPCLPAITLDNICATFGGQGAFRLVASFLRRNQKFTSIVVPDSTYCNVYAPFLAESLRVDFAKTTPQSFLPSVEVIAELLAQPGCAGFQYVRFHNPSGESYSEQQLEMIMTVLEQRNQYLVYGETYEQLSFDEHDAEYLLVLKVAERVGFSRLIRIKTIAKDRGLAGFRAGYIIAPSEVVHFGIQYNSLLAFNPPMTNTRLLVANAYLSAAHFCGIRLPKVEQYLNLEQAQCDELLQQFDIDSSLQRSILRDNIDLIRLELFGRDSQVQSFEPNDLIQNDRFQFMPPRGGINATIALPALENVDEIDLVRKTYLLTGLILHTTSFLSHRNQLHLRITLSQDSEVVVETLRALKYVLDCTDQLELFSKNHFHVEQDDIQDIG